MGLWVMLALGRGFLRVAAFWAFLGFFRSGLIVFFALFLATMRGGMLFHGFRRWRLSSCR
jgi:hypothetical protein